MHAALPKSKLEQLLDDMMVELQPDLLATLRDLVRIPSENLPPYGNEQACQMYVAERLRELDIQPDIYDIDSVPGMAAHPQFWPGRFYRNRPNVNGRLRGGGGRSLILSGHIDTVPANTPVAWSHAPYGGEHVDGRIYGRGSWDMKAGVAMNLTVLRALRRLDATLGGDLIFETVVDEEFGGANGTLAGRLRGYHADAAVITESTSLRICPAQRGGRTVHVLLRGPGGLLLTGQSAGRVTDQLAYLLNRLPEFASLRQSRIPVDPYYRNCSDPFAVWVTNIAIGQWGWTQPISVAESCRVELYWQTMPDETGERVMQEFQAWWNQILDARPDLFSVHPEVTLPMRWLPGCSIPADAPLVREFAETAASLDAPARVEGLDAPSDMFVFHQCFNTPAIMWGPHGGNAHQADEYVEIDSLFTAARVLLRFVGRWCGLDLLGDSLR
jgi:acetylornithine deacetylase